jgi:hypothetical protein
LAQTEVGKLGSSLQNIKETPTPLQIQIQKFVKVMAIMGIAVFLLVWVFIFWKTHNLLTSLLKDSHSQCQFSRRNTCCIYYFHGLRIMAIDEGRRNSQKNQNSRKLRKCYSFVRTKQERLQKIK